MRVDGISALYGLWEAFTRKGRWHRVNFALKRRHNVWAALARGGLCVAHICPCVFSPLRTKKKGSDFMHPSVIFAILLLTMLLLLRFTTY